MISFSVRKTNYNPNSLWRSRKYAERDITQSLPVAEELDGTPFADPSLLVSDSPEVPILQGLQPDKGVEDLQTGNTAPWQPD